MTAPALDLDDLTLESGSHTSRTDGVCLMEAVAWYAGQDHSDMPPCVSPVLRSYGIKLNDSLPADERQQLKRFIPDLIGTAGDGHDDTRVALARKTLMTEWLPQWLRLAKLDDLAEKSIAAQDLTGSELNTALWAIRDLTWQARQERWEPVRARIREAVTKAVTDKLAEKQDGSADADAVAVAVAAAAAVAVAVAAAAAAAAAVAVAVAAAVAVADAAAVADADAAADAAAAAAADAAAVAAAAAAADAMPKPYTDAWYQWRAQLRSKVYDAVRARLRTEPAYAQVEALRTTQLEQALDLYSRMIHVGAEVSA